jgi:hypothetical protein
MLRANTTTQTEGNLKACPYLCGRSLPAVRLFKPVHNVVPNAACKQHRLLAHEGHMLAQPLGVVQAEVPPVDQHTARGGQVVALEQLDDCGLCVCEGNHTQVECRTEQGSDSRSSVKVVDQHAAGCGEGVALKQFDDGGLCVHNIAQHDRAGQDRALTAVNPQSSVTLVPRPPAS